MRKILKDTCIFAALMVLAIFTFSITVVGFTAEIKLVFEIFGLALVLSVFNYFFDEKTSFPILSGYLIKYAAVSLMVIAFGFIAGWFFPSNFWMAFIYVGVIMAIVYALDSVKTESDIEEINEMVKLNKNETIGVRPLSKRHGWKVLVVLFITMTVLTICSAAGLIALRNLENYFLTGLLVSAAASIVLLFLLVIYLIVYRTRLKKMNGKQG